MGEINKYNGSYSVDLQTASNSYAAEWRSFDIKWRSSSASQLRSLKYMENLDRTLFSSAHRCLAFVEQLKAPVNDKFTHTRNMCQNEFIS